MAKKSVEKNVTFWKAEAKEYKKSAKIYKRAFESLVEAIGFNAEPDLSHHKSGGENETSTESASDS